MILGFARPVTIAESGSLQKRRDFSLGMGLFEGSIYIAVEAFQSWYYDSTNSIIDEVPVVWGLDSMLPNSSRLIGQLSFHLAQA